MRAAQAGAPPHAAPFYRALRLAVSFAASLALLFLLAMGAGLGIPDLARGLSEVPLAAILPVILAQVLVVLAGARKWQITLSALPGHPVRLPFAICSTATTLGTLAGQIFPIQIATPIIRGWLAQRQKVPLLRSVGGSVYEQMIDFLVLAAAGAASLMLWMTGTGWVAALVMSFAVLAGLALAVGPVLGGLARGAALIDFRVLSGPMHRLSKGLSEAARLPRAALRELISLGLLRYLLLVAINVGLLTLLQPQAEPMLLVIFYPVILLLMSAPIFPGGLGVTEVSWAGVLMLTGSTGAEAVEAAILLRILSTAAFLAAVPALLGFGLAASRKTAS